MKQNDLCYLSAVEMAKQIRQKELSVREVMEAHLDQIEQINPKVNAIITLVAEQALEQAIAADRALSNGDAKGALFGLPVAHKDLADTKGIRTTYGSPIYKDHVPEHDALIVERLKQAGAITVGKTNVPEFGAGSQTFNPLFGATSNPYDLSKTCGGSSGGAAVALASGMVPIADGSDLGGSLRNPANFCNVVGFRTSPGRVPVWPSQAGWYSLSIHGPMARTVADVGLMLSALAGPDPRVPIANPESGELFANSLERDFKGTRIAWSQDLGSFPVDPSVTRVLESQRYVFKDLGCLVDEAEPDFRDADEVFKVLRAWNFEIDFGALLEEHRGKMKESVIWNTESGQKLTGPQIGQAEVNRTALYHRLREFLETYEFLLLPVSQVPPFDITQEYITEINGVEMETYLDWMKSCYYISATGLPAISVPCGFTPEGLPVGLQIVGRHQDDLGVLQLAYAFEQATQVGTKRPQFSDGA
ncbi:MAG: amidase [Chloroflexota bacterium]